MSAADIAVALGDARREARGWRCRCPLHQGRSLTLRDGDRGRLLALRFGGCDSRDVFIELRRRGLLDGRTRPAGVSNEIVGGRFTAIDIDGVVLGTFDTLREPTRAFPERGGMR